MVTVTCFQCGSDVEKYPRDLKRSNRVFCDSECHAKYQSEKPKEEHPCYQGGKVSVSCEWCEEKKKVVPARVRNQDNFFCDHDCFGNFNSENYSGEGNPNYKGGDWEHNYRGSSWAPTRNKVRERDSYSCQNCNVSMEELGQIPDCHHIKPEHQFENSDDAHFEENLVLLCRDCHNLFDELPEQEQRERLNLFPNKG